MAVKPYDEDQSIHSMTTRQLRQYISDKATEAQNRIDSPGFDGSDKATSEMMDFITKGGKVKRSTSNMDKAQMREYAYALRTFNMMDEESDFARRTLWQKDKARYNKFIENRIAQEGKDSYWAQYLTSKGNVSKRGYEDYKQYIEFIKAIQDVKYQYTYKTLTTKALNAMEKGQPEDLRNMAKILNKVYKDSKGLHLTTSQLVDKFEIAWDAQLEKAKPKPKSVPSSKRSKKKSSSNVKTKTVGKLRDNAKVHR